MAERSNKAGSPDPGMRPARTFTDFVHTRRTSRDRFRPSGGKQWVRDAARTCGVALPKLYGRFDTPAAVSFADLPDRFVLKPTDLFGRKAELKRARARVRRLDRRSARVAPSLLRRTGRDFLIRWGSLGGDEMSGPRRSSPAAAKDSGER